MAKQPTIERRFFESRLELRAASENATPNKIRGFAAKFNTYSENLGDEEVTFREIILPGAFDNILLDDVRALFNHDPSLILARSKNGRGTLQLGVNEIGLWYEFDAPDSRVGKDLLEAIRRGDIDQSSFAFIVSSDNGEQWDVKSNEDGTETITRSIIKVGRLIDVSPVTYPAYNDTTAAARSLAEFRSANPPTLPNKPTDRQLSEVLDWAARFGALPQTQTK